MNATVEREESFKLADKGKDEGPDLKSTQPALFGTAVVTKDGLSMLLRLALSWDLLVRFYPAYAASRG